MKIITPVGLKLKPLCKIFVFIQVVMGAFLFYMCSNCFVLVCGMEHAFVSTQKLGTNCWTFVNAIFHLKIIFRLISLHK